MSGGRNKTLSKHFQNSINRRLTTQRTHLYLHLKRFLDSDKKDPSAWSLRGLFRCNVRWMSVVCVNPSHKFKEMWLLTYQTNIYRDVSSGLVRMLVMNCAIAFRIRSDSFTRYSSQMVVISSLRVKGIRKQVWYGCLVIGNSFRHSGFW